jgi:hypothetical protein
MKVIGDSDRARLAVIGSQHGNEPFGRDVILRLAEDFKEVSDLLLVVANEEALAQNVRFIDEDLNRAYGKPPGSSHEASVAHRITQTIENVPLVLDLHTTQADVREFPIIVRYRTEEQCLISATDYRDVAYMDLPHGGDNSGLGSISGGGLALEFSHSYTTNSFDQAYRDVYTIIERVLSGVARQPRPRRIFHVTHVAPWIAPEELALNDFRYSPELGGYAVLPNASEYVGKHRGFVATEVIDVEL